MALHTERKGRLRPPLSGILLIAAILSCSFDYDEAVVEKELSEYIPDSVMTGFSQTVIEEDGSKIRILASRAEIYEKLDKMVAEEIAFQEFDAEGRLRTEGRAEAAIYYTDTENAEFTGSIVFTLVEEGTTLAAEGISWEKESKRLTTPPGATVLLEREDGSFIEGRDMIADLRTMVVELGRAVRGRIVIKEEDRISNESGGE